MNETGAPKALAVMARHDVEPDPMPEIVFGRSALADAFGVLSAPCQLVTGWYVLEPRTEAIISHCGVVTERVTEPGIQFSNTCGRSIIQVSTAQAALQIEHANVLDSVGNPIVVSAVM